MRRILVTGANKGIGLAIVEGILQEHPDTFVHLGARDPERGRAAVAGLVEQHAAWKERIGLVTLDVASDASVADAGRQLAQRLGQERLYGVVNNAGIGVSSGDLAAVLGTNLFGIHRVCQASLPLLDAAGRVVNVTSASGPLFVSSCSPERQRFFLDAQLTWPRLQAFVDECLELVGDASAFAARGLGAFSPYGLSKACANTYTMILAREHPHLKINACTPGFISTDMTRPYAESEGKSPADLGMKTPAEGARAPLHLLFGTLEGNGHYYGSDAKRSPLDRYRSPGSAEYTGP